MKYFTNKYTKLQEIKKNIIQAVATLITNANLKGFFEGKIYKGNTKVACVPGLNCYSCPGAIGSCPIGSLQAVIGSKKFNISYYVFGIIILIGASQIFKVCNTVGFCNIASNVFDQCFRSWSTLFL